jgi:hypothetical protein
LLLFLGRIAFGQNSQKNYIDGREYIIDYLKSPYRQAFPKAYLEKTGPFKRDQKEISKYNTIIKLNDKNCSIAVQQYQLSHNSIVKLGFGKLNKDSIFYIGVDKKPASYYYLKQSCDIKFIGYSRYGKSIEFYFELITKNDKLIFSIDSEPKSLITQFDYFFDE